MERGRGGPRAGQGRVRDGHAWCRAGIRTSPWPTCGSARVGSPRPRRCCSARTRRCRPCSPRLDCISPRGDHDLARAAALRGLRVLGDDRLRAAELLTVLVDAELALGDVAAADRGVRRADRARQRPRRPAAAGPRRGSARPGARRDRRCRRSDRAAGDDRRSARRPAASVAAGRVADRSGPPARRRPATRPARRSTPRRPRPPWPRSTWCSTPDDVALLERLGRARRAAAGRPDRRLASRREVVDRLVRGHDRPAAGHQGPALPRRAHRPPGSRAPRARPRRPRRGSPRAAESTGGRSEMRAPCSTRGARRRIGIASRRCEPRPTTRWPAASSSRRGVPGRARPARGQLARAFGLGGRDRRRSAAERARLNVTRALRAAITKLADALPAAGAVLDRRVRTGLYCVYEPADDDEVRWIVQS